MEDVVKTSQKWNFSGKVMSVFEVVCGGRLFLCSGCSSDIFFSVQSCSNHSLKHLKSEPFESLGI